MNEGNQHVDSTEKTAEDQQTVKLSLGMQTDRGKFVGR